MNIQGIEYSFQVASDVATRDGIGLECFRIDGSKEELVLEVFRDDTLKTWTYSQFAESLPLELIEHVIAIARQQLGDFVP